MYWQMICVFLLLQTVDTESSSNSPSSSSTSEYSDDDTCPKHIYENCQKDDCSNSEEEKYVVCYFTNWAWYRSGRASFRPENINPSLCTHIIFAFSSLNSSSFLMVSSDTWADIDNKFYSLVTAYREKGVKVLISVGGWTNSSGLYWSTMINNTTLRANFVTTAKTFIEKYGFDGLDLDYEYPGCPQGDSTVVNSTDKVMFNQLVRELKHEFNGDYLLTAATAGGKTLIEKCYNLEELCQLVDWVNIMSYEYHSYSDGETGSNAPICGSGSDWGVVDTIKYYRKVLKCPANKMVLGIPFYGMSFALANSSKHTFGEPVIGAGDAGTYTAEAGTLSYYEIMCLLKNSGWTAGFNQGNGSYIYNGTQFSSFDNTIDIIQKSCLINKYFKLQGAMIYALDYDDFNNMCGFGSYPLLKTVNKQLRCWNETYDN